MYYILTKIEPEHHSGFCALGHEIHISRHLLLDMFNEKYIDPENDTIVTVSLDRKFLYMNMFKNIISYEDFRLKNIDDKYIINLWTFIVSKIEELDKYYINDFKKKSNYPINNFLYKNISKKYRQLLCNIYYEPIPESFIIKKYFLIHHRTINKKYSNNNIDNNYNYTIQIIKFLMDKFSDINIIIFSADNTIKFLDLPIINSLSLYCSLMNNINCVALISEISGGGEIAQYCHNNLICHYYNSYNFSPIEPINLNLLQEYSYIHENWNTHGSTNAIIIRTNINDMLNFILRAV